MKQDPHGQTVKYKGASRRCRHRTIGRRRLHRDEQSVAGLANTICVHCGANDYRYCRFAAANSADDDADEGRSICFDAIAALTVSFRGRPRGRNPSTPPRQNPARHKYSRLRCTFSSRASSLTFSPASIRRTALALNSLLYSPLRLGISSPPENCPHYHCLIGGVHSSRDAHYCAPTAQNRTCRFPAYGLPPWVVDEKLSVRAPDLRSRCPGSVSGACLAGVRFPRPLPFAPPAPMAVARRRSSASSLLWESLTSRDCASSASACALPMRAAGTADGQPRDLPVPAQGTSRHAGVSDSAGSRHDLQ
jgi:hypothetical protein